VSAPVVMPKLLSLQAPAAQSAEGSVTVTAPSDVQVTASITGGDSLLTIKSVTAVIYVWRDANPNEGKQLPQIPGSNTKAGQVSQIFVPQVVGTSAGNTALSVPAGATVTVVVQLAPPANQAAGIGMAASNVNGTTWPAVSVPITWIAGPADTPVQVTPASIHVAASPGRTAYSGVMIDNAPVAAKVLLTLASPDTIIRANAVTYLPEKRQPTEQELAQMPINLRQQA